jgi:hypothetical protein
VRARRGAVGGCLHFVVAAQKDKGEAASTWSSDRSMIQWVAG